MSTTKPQFQYPQSTIELDYDAVIVGAGFGGLVMLYQLRDLGFSARVIEAGSGVGGTWYWNRYPGARCDVESLDYSYQFSDDLEQDWEWTERYSGQPEILAYIEHVAERFDLTKDIQFNTRVESAHFKEDSDSWLIETDSGERLNAKFCIMATGCLSSANIPNIAGIGDFRGEQYHTGNWPHEPVDFAGKSVAVIGTGSSGIQSIPEIAKQAKSLFVFQRTPNYSVPANNYPMDPAFQANIKADYKGHRARLADLPTATFRAANEQSALDVGPAEREAVYEAAWQEGGLLFLGAFSDLIVNQESNETAAEFVRNKIHSIVKDPKTASLLSPDNVLGCKRPCSDSGYFEAYNRDNVHLVDLHTAPIERITASGVKTSEQEYKFDCIVFATGFDAMTGSLDRIDIRGLNGARLKQKWAPGPKTYLGLTTAGFPNFFTMTGPGSPSVLANMVIGVEHHAKWIAECLNYLRAQEKSRIENTEDAENDWAEQVNKAANRTLYTSCNSWYLGANIPGKPRTFLPYSGGFPRYRKKCQEVVENNYRGFKFA